MSKVTVARSRGHVVTVVDPWVENKKSKKKQILVGRLPTPFAIKRTSLEVQRACWDQKRHIFRTGRPIRTSNLVRTAQMERKDPFHRQAPWPPRSKVAVARSPVWRSKGHRSRSPGRLMPAIKPMKLGYCMRAGAYRVAHPAATNLFRNVLRSL